MSLLWSPLPLWLDISGRQVWFSLESSCSQV